MKCFLMLFLISCQIAEAQDTISASLVTPFCYRFGIEKDKFVGDGADKLLASIRKSQFVLLGETHNDAKIAEFTDLLLDTLSEMNFRHFLTEHGRYGLQLLLEEIKKDPTVSKGLCRINTKEYSRLNKFPFPFLSGIEDASFMSTAIDKGYQLFGIDQEFYYSYPFLFETLYEKSNKTEWIKNSYQQAIYFILSQYKLESANKDYSVCKSLLESEVIKQFFSNVNSGFASNELINDIILSWEIYEANRVNRRESFLKRGDLMKNRFLDYYINETTKDSVLAKYVIKLGAQHTMRGVTPLGIEDVGELVHQLAIEHHKTDLNIYFLFRYYLDEEEELGYFDNSEGNSKWLTERKPLMLQGLPDEWVLIDLQALGEMIDATNIFVYEPIAEIIKRHDYVIMPPASDNVSENRKKE